MKIILHIGHFKTGTTAFQNYMHENREKLLRNRILYPLGPSSLPKQHGLIIVPPVRQGEYGPLEAWLSELNLKNIDCLVLSAEGLSNPATGGGAKIIPLLKTFGSVHIIYVVRHWTEYLKSRYIQNIKQGDSWTWSSYVRECANIKNRNIDYDYSLVAADYISGSPDSFHLSGYNGSSTISDILTELLRHCDNYHFKDLPSSMTHNVSLNEVEVEILRLMNDSKNDYGNNNNRFKSLQDQTVLTRQHNLKKVAASAARSSEIVACIKNLILENPSDTPDSIHGTVTHWQKCLEVLCKKNALNYPFSYTEGDSRIVEKYGSNYSFAQLPDFLKEALFSYL